MIRFNPGDKVVGLMGSADEEEKIYTFVEYITNEHPHFFYESWSNCFLATGELQHRADSKCIWFANKRNILTEVTREI